MLRHQPSVSDWSSPLSFFSSFFCCSSFFFFSFSIASFSSSVIWWSICSFFSSAPTALSFLAPQPLAPQPLPAWTARRDPPPRLTKPATVKQARIFFKSFTSILNPPFVFIKLWVAFMECYFNSTGKSASCHSCQPPLITWTSSNPLSFIFSVTPAEDFSFETSKISVYSEEIKQRSNGKHPQQTVSKHTLTVSDNRHGKRRHHKSNCQAGCWKKRRVLRWRQDHRSALPHSSLGCLLYWVDYKIKFLFCILFS